MKMEGAEPKNLLSWKSAGITLFCIVVSLAGFVLNFKPNRLSEKVRSLTKPVLVPLGLTQGWEMFGGGKINLAYAARIDLTYPDGTVTARQVRPRWVPFTRWSENKMYEGLVQDGHARDLEQVLLWECRNRRSKDGALPAVAAFMRAPIPIPRLGQGKPEEDPFARPAAYAPVTTAVCPR